MKNIEFKTNIVVNNVSLEIRKYQNLLELLAINPSNNSHKISKIYNIGEEQITLENVNDYVLNMSDINDFINRSISLFSDPLLVPSE